MPKGKVPVSVGSTGFSTDASQVPVAFSPLVCGSDVACVQSERGLRSLVADTTQEPVHLVKSVSGTPCHRLFRAQALGSHDALP